MELTQNRKKIAIIGAGVRFPGGKNTVADFWQALLDGEDLLEPIPADRFDWQSFYFPDRRPGSIIAKKGGFTKGIEEFDPLFFGIAPKEAATMDPQQRQLLECAWEAFEDAGLKIENYSGSETGVYIGFAGSEYGYIQESYLNREALGSKSSTGFAMSIGPNRISYIFNFQGPSFAVDTACSSVLSAVNVALNDLYSGRVNQALVGGTTSLINPESYIGFTRAEFLSIDSTCKTFDASANGYVRSEGTGLFLLKPLEDAIRDGNNIYACIHGGFVNQDGKSDGLSAPNVDSQISMLQSSYEVNKIPKEKVLYVEAHGTGTQAGDLAEATSIGKVLGLAKARDERLLVGSCKSNLGHMETAAGVAALAKAMMIAKTGLVPKNLHFNTPNPKLNLEENRIKVPCETLKLPKSDDYFIGVNSFGFGGTNAHLILGPPPASKPADFSADPVFKEKPYLYLSAKSEKGLALQAEKYLEKLIKKPELFNNEFLSASITNRSKLDHNLGVWAKDALQLQKSLRHFIKTTQSDENSLIARSATQKSKLGFVFSGMGTQWWGMARSLIEKDLEFKNKIQQISQMLSKVGWQSPKGRTLYEELISDANESQIQRTTVAQVGIMAIQVALFEKLKSWGVQPDFVLGHSVGEVAAAFASGALSLEASVKLIAERGTIQALLENQGGMLAVELDEEGAKELLLSFDGKVEIAALNSPRNLVLCGDSDALEIISKQLTERGVFNRLLDVIVPFHSFRMQQHRDEFLKRTGELPTQKMTLPMISTVTGSWIQGHELGTYYWYQNMREPVQFEKAVRTSLEQGQCSFIEIGAHPALQQHLKNISSSSLVLGTLSKKMDSLDSLSRLSFSAYAAGFSINMTNIVGRAANWSQIPLRAFDRQKYWIEPEEYHKLRLGEPTHPFIRRGESGQPGYDADVNFKIQIDPRKWFFVRDHKVQDEIVIPGALSLEMSIAAAHLLEKRATVHLENVDFDKMIFVRDDEKCLNMNLNYSAFTGQFAISDVDEKTVFMRGSLAKGSEVKKLNIGSIETLKQGLTRHHSLERAYELIGQSGLPYGPTFKLLKEAYSSKNQCLAKIELHPSIEFEASKFYVHPAVLDNAFQSALLTANVGKANRLPIYIPSKVKHLYFHQKPQTQSVWVYFKIKHQDDKDLNADVCLIDENGNEFLTVIDLWKKYIKGSADDTLEELLYETKLVKKTGFYEQLGRGTSDFSTVQLGDFEKTLKNFPKKEDYNWDVVKETVDFSYASQIRALRSVGAKFELGKPLYSIDIPKWSGGNPKTSKVMQLFINSLAAGGYLEKKGESDFLVKKATTDAEYEKMKKNLESLKSSYPIDLGLILRILPRQPEVLSGELDPIKLMFRDGPTQELFDFYSKGVSSHEYNLFAARLLKEMCSKLPKGSLIRVLEVGGGTGGCTSHVLPVLKDFNVEYTFTDISSSFFSEATRQFMEFDFVHYQTLDLERDLSSQGFIEQSFDIVIGSNVVHATKSVENSLRAVRRLIKPKGFMLMIELSGHTPIIEGTFGLMEGYNLFEDRQVRSDFPTMTGRQWADQMEKVGFTNVSFTALNVQEQNVLIGFQPQQSRREEILLLELEKRFKQTGLKNLIVVDEVGEISAGIQKWIPRFSNPVNFKAKKSLVDFSDADWDSIAKLKTEETQILYIVRNEETLSGSDPMKNLVNIFSETSAFFRILDEKGVRCVFCFVHSDLKVSNELPVRSPVSASISCMRRVLSNEVGPVRFRHIDVDSMDSGIRVLAEVTENSFEDEVYLIEKPTHYDRFVERVRRFQKNPPKTIVNPRVDQFQFSLPPGTSGFDSITTHDKKPRKPGPNEVRLRVKRVGMNFRDLLNASGMYSAKMLEDEGLKPNIGIECSGEVIEVGSSIKDLKTGDRVVAISEECIASEITVSRHKLGLLPPTIDYDFGSGLVVFITVFHTMITMARLKKGDRVLVHSAAGGVGLAAIEICKAVGAEVYATAGSEEKRYYVKSLGVKYVYDSRKLDFKEQIMKDTAGAGVDILINSLAGPAIWESLNCLSPFGRFIEIGKMDLIQNTRMGLKPFLKNISYFCFDLSIVSLHYGERLQEMIRQTIDFVVANNLKMIPFEKFPISQCKEVFRRFSKGQHIGKFILDLDSEEKIEKVPSLKWQAQDDNSTFVIIGGTSGFGLACAEWLGSRGVRNLVLVSRTGIKYDSDRAKVEHLKSQDLKIHLENCDATDPLAVKEVLKKYGPIEGIIHGAMVLKDRFFVKMSESEYTQALKPKVDVAWNLHQACQELDLNPKYFVCFSSMAAELGNSGQSNYAAANGYMQGLMAMRRAQGQSGICISWGVLAEVGFLARNPEDQFEAQYWRPIPLRHSLAALELCLLNQVTHIMVQNIDWAENFKMWPKIGSSLRLSELQKTGATDKSDGQKWITDLKTLSHEAALISLRDAIKMTLSKIVGLESSKIDHNSSLLNFGLDSLSANQLRGWIMKELDVDLPLLKIMSGPTLTAFAEELLLQVRKKVEAPIVNKKSALVVSRSDVKPRARVVYFPYLLAKADSHQTWSQFLPTDLQIIAVNIPGFADRSDESLKFDLQEFAKEVATELSALPDLPLVFASTSYGGFLSLHVLSALIEMGGRKPDHVVIAGMHAPFEDAELLKIKELASNFDRTKKLTDEQAQILSQVGNLSSITDEGRSWEFTSELFHFMSRSMESVKSYKNKEWAMNLTVMRGNSDPLNSEESVQRWKRWTGAKAVNFESVSGSHLFFVKDGKKLAEKVRTAIQGG